MNEMHKCLDCHYKGDADKHGKCPRCGSTAMVSQAGTYVRFEWTPDGEPSAIYLGITPPGSK